MEPMVEMGTMSSRGQLCIPSGMRKLLKLRKGSKVVFLAMGDSLLMKPVTEQSFEEITRPFKEAVAKSGLKESDVPDIVHRFRREKSGRKAGKY